MQIVEICFEKQSSIRKTHRALRAFYGAHIRPLERLIRETIDRFYNTFTLNDITHRVRCRTVRTQQAIDGVQHSVDYDLNVSIRHRTQQLNLCQSTLLRILRKYLGLRAYRIQFVQELKPQDHRSRRKQSY